MSKVAAQKANDELINSFANGISMALKKNGGEIWGSARIEDYIGKDNSGAQRAYECSYGCHPSNGKSPASIYDYKEIKIK